MQVPPQVMDLVRKHGWTVLKQFVPDPGPLLQQALGRVTSRGTALKHARTLVDGRLGPARLEGQLRWVVFSGDEPVDAIPPVKGNLASQLAKYDRANLRTPDEFRVGRTKQLLKKAAGRSLGNLRENSSLSRPTPRSNGAKKPERFHERTEEMPELLDQLTSSPAFPFAEHDQVPDTPGIYLFSEGPNPMYVGNTRKLKTRLRQHGSPRGTENSASFAYRLALQAAESQGLKPAGTRKEKAKDPEFAALFKAQRQRVAEMDAQFIELEDPVQRTLFEVFAAEALGLEEFNDFETH